MNKTQFQKQLFAALALFSMLVSTTLYGAKKELTYEEAMAKFNAAQDKHAKALAQADKYLQEAQKYRKMARDIKMKNLPTLMKPMPATVQQEMQPEEELEMPVTIQPVELETPQTYRTQESITPTEPEFEEALSVSTPVRARKIRNY